MNDEFYTQLEDIERELKYYTDHFKDKTVYCNCDSKESNFTKYFEDNFDRLKLKKLNRTSLEEGFDFRSKECIELLKESDVVVTNPPFSLFRHHLAQSIEYGKKFLIIGPTKAIMFKDPFTLIKDKKVWLGVSPRCMEFIIPSGETRSINACYFTNLNHGIDKEAVVLTKNYYGHESDYPTYDNYNGIEVDRVINIPLDYDGVMGVPISFLNKHNPDQFEIIKFRTGDDGKDLRIDGKRPYFRILIRRIK